jgi:hypothetical protein
MTAEPMVVRVPFQDTPLVPPDPERVRKLRLHLVEAMRDLRTAKRPDRLIQPATSEPTGFAAAVVRTGCATCQGHCCRGGGEHAYLDERTLARVRTARPELEARAVIGLYVAALAPRAYAGSCLFHGESGCTLPRLLRAELCNSYYCNGLRDVLRLPVLPDAVVIQAERGGQRRRSAVLRQDSPVSRPSSPSP